MISRKTFICIFCYFAVTLYGYDLVLCIPVPLVDMVLPCGFFYWKVVVLDGRHAGRRVYLASVLCFCWFLNFPLTFSFPFYCQVSGESPSFLNSWFPQETLPLYSCHFFRPSIPLVKAMDAKVPKLHSILAPVVPCIGGKIAHIFSQSSHL